MQQGAWRLAPTATSSISALSARDVVQTATNTVTGTIPVGDAAVAFSPDGTTAYAGAGSVYVIDTSTLAVTTVIPTQFAGALGVTPDGTLLYVGGASLTEPGSIINTQSLQITGTFPSGGGILIH